MDHQNKRGTLHRLLFGRGGPVPERKEMTRGQQTAWIIGAIVLVALFALNYVKTHDASDPYARCNGIIPQGSECRAAVAVERLNRLN